MNVMVGVQQLASMSDRCPGSDPVGAIFEETLEHLGPLDRELMLFCATSNVLAVRWLLHLGAHWEARDTNNSTCLHVACRAGSLQVINELLLYKALLESLDLAKWSPLHIAAFMGRREAVARLLRAGASPHLHNLSQQTPADLCPDFATLSAFKETGEDAEVMVEEAPIWSACADEDNVSTPMECEHIPFFLPPTPALRCQDLREDLWNIAVRIFNKQPSYGLAFAVATGLGDNYADALLAILKFHDTSRSHVGAFLGEAFSLSSLVRLSIFDTIPLVDTGVVSALKRTFSIFQLPEDFQKINRLLVTVAHVWWRQHTPPIDARQSGLSGGPGRMKSPELCGCELKARLINHEGFSQLLFSTVLLHWYMYADGKSGKREFPFKLWEQLNCGLGAGGSNLPSSLQKRIYEILDKGFINELALASPNEEATNSSMSHRDGDQSDKDGGSPDEGAGLPKLALSKLDVSHSILAPCASLEGWVQHRPFSAHPSSDLPSEVSEVPFSSPDGFVHLASPRTMHMPPDNIMGDAMGMEPSFLRPPTGGQTWLSLCSSLLFFWENASQVGPSNALPHTVIDLRMTEYCYKSVSPKTSRLMDDSVIVLTGSFKSPVTRALQSIQELAVGEQKEPPNTSRPTWMPPDREPLISVIHLLPDGRWQELHLSRLELRFPSALEASRWAEQFDLLHAKDTYESSVCNPSRASASRSSQTRQTEPQPEEEEEEEARYIAKQIEEADEEFT